MLGGRPLGWLEREVVSLLLVNLKLFFFPPTLRILPQLVLTLPSFSLERRTGTGTGLQVE